MTTSVQNLSDLPGAFVFILLCGFATSREVCFSVRHKSRTRSIHHKAEGPPPVEHEGTKKTKGKQVKPGNLIEQKLTKATKEDEEVQSRRRKEFLVFTSFFFPS